MRKFVPVLLLLPAILLVPILADAAANTRIVQKGRAFRPGTVTIMRGENLTSTNDDSFIH